VLIKSSSRGPFVLLSVDEQNRTLRFMTKDNAKGCYFINTYDYDAHLIGKTPFPKFSDSCWGSFGYGTGHGGAVSPDYASVAYLESGDLSCFDARTGARRVLLPNLARAANDVELLRWISNTELLVAVTVAVKDQHQPDIRLKDARLLLIDTEKQAVVFDLHPENLKSSQFSLSHSKRYLAYWEGSGMFESRGSFKIFDLWERRETAMTESGEAAIFKGPHWSPDDDALAYVMDNKLMRFSIASKQSEALKSFGQHSRVLLQGYQGKRLYYSVEPTDTLHPIIRLFYFDLSTRQETQFDEWPWNVFVGSDETMIYYILGQEPL
jgi:hypothetical protein